MEPYDISVDPSRRMLSMTMRGFWDMTTFEAFAKAFSQALRQLHRMGGCELALVDGSEFSVQSRDVLMRFGEVMRENEPYLAKRTASIVATELNRLQATRVGEVLNRRDFSNRADAEAWLFGES